MREARHTVITRRGAALVLTTAILAVVFYLALELVRSLL